MNERVIMAAQRVPRVIIFCQQGQDRDDPRCYRQVGCFGRRTVGMLVIRFTKFANH